MAGYDVSSPADRADAFVEDVGRTVIQRFLAQPRRTYLGASSLGDPCSRKLQFAYMGTPKERDTSDQLHADPARSLSRLWVLTRGHHFEEVLVNDFREAGYDLRTHVLDRTSGRHRQFGFAACDGRIKGHIDGVFVSGPPTMAYPALWENKVVGYESYRDIVSRGVKAARPLYFAQMQIYMHFMELAANPAIFTVLCANKMELYAERVAFDLGATQELIDKAARILAAADAGEMLPRVSRDFNYYWCKMCDFQRACTEVGI